MSKKDMQYTECECHNPDHLDTGRNMWEGEIEDEALFEKTDTMTVTIMNEGKVAMCTCSWCSYVNTVDLVNEQITIDCDGKKTVLGVVNKAKGGSITTTLSRMFINFINTGILKTKYEVGGLNVTFCSGISGMGDRNAYAFFYTKHSFGEWKETTLPDGRVVSTRNNGLFYEFKREGHSYTNTDLYTDTGVILMDIKVDDNKLYVCFDMAKMISDYLGLSIGYEPEEVKTEEVNVKEVINVETDHMLVFVDSEGVKETLEGSGSYFLRADGTFKSHIRKIVEEEYTAGCAYVFGRCDDVRRVFN